MPPAMSQDSTKANPMNLQTLRQRIDRLDQKLLKLLNTRAALALKVGAIKKKQGRTIFDPKREQEILRALGEANAGPLSTPAVHAIYRHILQQVRRLEKSA